MVKLGSITQMELCAVHRLQFLWRSLGWWWYWWLIHPRPWQLGQEGWWHVIIIIVVGCPRFTIIDAFCRYLVSFFSIVLVFFLVRSFADN